MGEIFSQPKDGFHISFSKGEFNHTFCGENKVKGAKCPNCKRPLLQLFSFDARDSRLEIPEGLEHVNLFYCWCCNLPDGPFFYAVTNAGIKVLLYAKGKEDFQEPYPDYPEFFPERDIELESMSEEWREAIRLTNKGEVEDISTHLLDDTTLLEPQHQVGGPPWLMQTYEPLICPKCKTIMPFFAEACNDNKTDRVGFVDSQFTYILFSFCRSCKIVGAINQTD